jgi:hypothetical protein
VTALRVEPGGADELAWALPTHQRVALGGVETLLVPLLQVRRLEDPNVGKDVPHHVVL